MNKIIRKITFIILMFLILTSIATNIEATITIDGITYLTNGDIYYDNDMVGIKIVPENKYYYCINKSWTLKGLTEKAKFVSTSATDIKSQAFHVTLPSKKERGMAEDALKKAVSNYKNQKNEEIKTMKALTLEQKESVCVSTKKSTDKWDRIEAAIYGFADEFDVKRMTIQHSLWRLQNQRGETSADGKEPRMYLWNVANGYINWIDAGGPELSEESEDAKISISSANSSYKVGPFYVKYNTETYCDTSGYGLDNNGEISFTKDLTAIIVDQDGKSITNFKYVDIEGNELDTIPNGEEFYVEMPYTGKLKKVQLTVGLEYIAEACGKRTDTITTEHSWEYEWQTPLITVSNPYYIHGSICKKSPNANEPFTDKQLQDEQYVTSETACCQGIEEGCGYWCYPGSYSIEGEIKHKSSTQYGFQNMREFEGEIIYDKQEVTMTAEIENSEMEIAGYVWEDTKEGKDSKFNGLKDENDILLEGIEVRLYEYDTSKGISTLSNVLGTNPVLTDKNGYYSFTVTDPTKKYYVVFTYDGMIYTNTYGAGRSEYNTDEWNAASKGSELYSERAMFNTKFVSVGSYPAGYKTTAIFNDMVYLTDGKYNEVYNIYNSDVLAYKKLITEQLKTYLSTHTKLEDGQQNYIDAIYKPILNNITNGNEKIKARRILQFIWDCRINSYSGYESIRDGKESKTNELYPYYNKIVLTDLEGNKYTANKEENIDGFWIIYNGQLNVNQGIIRRDQTDLNLIEDLYKTVVSINGKDETYKYGSLSEKTLNLASSDIKSYTQGVAYSDFNYKVLSSSLNSEAQYEDGYAKIQVYVTYKIKVKNTSNIPTGVKEIVTYFDTNYFSYSDSYTTTKGQTLSGIEASYINSNGEETSLNKYSSNSFGMKANSNSIYGSSSETGAEFGTDLYISFADDIILENNESLAIYVTYRVGENSTKDSKYNCTYNKGKGNEAYVLLQDLLSSNDSKIEIGTISEINGFTTYYKKVLDVSETQNKYTNFYTYKSDIRPYDEYRAAGVFDSNSLPGNLTTNEVISAHNNYGKKLEDRSTIEDDWDEASTLIIEGKTEPRHILGNVWETVNQTSDYWIKNKEYAKYEGKNNLKDITVELIELKDGKEYVRAATTTDSDGKYEFSGYIPGEYTVRFIYGDKADYNSLVQISEGTTYKLADNNIQAAYNGLFYQSTKSNPKTNETQFWYANEENIRYSDAYDEVNRRIEVNNSINNYNYEQLVAALKHPTKYMAYAYTSMLDIYPEKAKTESTTSEPGYTISNIDFALTPRNMSDLQIDKEVTHIKMILANGMVQFDADTSTIREQGVPGVVQAARKHNINISMSSELVNGATLEITYKITVSNNSLEDVVIYHKDASSNVIAISLYGEDAAQLVYYEGLIRNYKDNFTNFEKQADETWISKIEAGRTELVELKTSKVEKVAAVARAYAIADFIPNNLEFIKNDYTGKSVNEYWDLYNSQITTGNELYQIWGDLDGTKNDLKEKYYEQNNIESEANKEPVVTNMNSQEIYESNKIVLSNKNNPLITTTLNPGESVSADIVLSKVISVNDSSDTKAYKNSVRILKLYSSSSKLQDMVGAESEKVIVSDPTGIRSIYMIIILTLIVAVIVGTGVFFIKKFVVQKNNK